MCPHTTNTQAKPAAGRSALAAEASKEASQQASQEEASKGTSKGASKEASKEARIQDALRTLQPYVALAMRFFFFVV